MNAADMMKRRLTLLRIDIEDAGKMYRWLQTRCDCGKAQRTDVDEARERYAAAWTAYDDAMKADASSRRVVAAAAPSIPGPASRRAVVVRLRCVGDLDARRCERRPMRHTFRVDRWGNIDRWDRERGCWSDDQRISMPTRKRLLRIAANIREGVPHPGDAKVYARTANDVEERCGMHGADVDARVGGVL